MKKLLIVNNNMHIGGVQKSLLNLLGEIHKDYDITLLLFYKGGRLLEEIPDDIKIIEARGPFRYFGMTKHDAKSGFDKLGRMFWASVTRVFGRKFTVSLMLPFQKKLFGFDTAVSFLHSGENHMFYGGCNEFVLKCSEAKKKITFLHCDYKKINANSKYNTEIYNQFDKIAACSEGCRQSFLNLLPQFKDKTFTVENCHNYNKIRNSAKAENISMPSDKLNVVTVARFGKEKGVLRAIRAVSKLEKKDLLKYYIIGDGTEFEQAKALIDELKLSENVTLLGEKENPYGYIKAADLLLIPSYSEAAPMVIGEAACLGVPVLSTETSSCEEMVVATGYGFVCKNSQDGITQALEEIINNQSLIKEKSSFLNSQKFSNANALKQFSELVK